jgi:CheY-like chemotaxis protein
MVTDKQDVSHNVSLLEEELVDEPVAESELPKGTRHLRIVVAEDDAEIREYLKTELSADYEVVACENGRVALSEIHKQLPHLVISDVMMPEMDGNTLCSKIKSNATTSHLPVILLTAKNRIFIVFILSAKVFNRFVSI